MEDAPEPKVLIVFIPVARVELPTEVKDPLKIPPVPEKLESVITPFLIIGLFKVVSFNIPSSVMFSDAPLTLLLTLSYVLSV